MKVLKYSKEILKKSERIQMTHKKVNNAKKGLKGMHVTVSGTISLRETPYGVIRKTRKEKKNEIHAFMDHIGDFLTFYISAQILPVFFVLEIRKKTFPKVSKNNMLTILQSYHHNEIIIPSMSLCLNEFQTFLSELQVGGYNGAARTLRCILETATEACEFQTESFRLTGKKLIEEYSKLFSSKAKKNQRKAFEIQHNAWASFLEMYRIYEKSKRIAPTYKELVNRLNSRQLFSDIPQLSDELKNIYQVLSDYIHPNSAKFQTAISGKQSINLRFNSEEFDNIFALGIRTLDAIQCLYILTLARFQEFKNSHAFLQTLSEKSEIEVEADSESLSPFLSLPLSKLLAQGVILKKSKKVKKNKHLATEKGTSLSKL
jgi:hypothetical protein